MSATMAGAIKALIESSGLGVAAYRDQAPAGAPLPFIVITEGIGRTNALAGDFGDAGRVPVIREQVQIDLWQQARDPATGERTEDYRLPGALHAALHGRMPVDPPTLCHPLLVQDSRRLPASQPKDGQAGSNLVRDTYTVLVVREVA